MRVLTKEEWKIPAFSWCPHIEEAAQLQIDNVMRLPFVKHAAFMPDLHSGFGVPIGSVIACDKVVIPFAVGSDISCGVLAVKTNLLRASIDTDTIKRIMGGIRTRIPVGRSWHIAPIAQIVEPGEDLPVTKNQFAAAKLQLGTLGSGNHFIELQVDEDGYVWSMIHSGSRNLGKKIADYYDKIAQQLNARWYSSVPKKWDLAFLPIEEPDAKHYMKEMTYAGKFAQQNRDVMAEQIREVIYEALHGTVEFEPAINIAHNYAAWENIKGDNLIVHRKGATSAREGQIGIIPGSQGTSSYIVKGLGNPLSFYSCSHGAGRRLGRNQAKRELDLETEIKRLDDLGVVHGIRHIDDLDEAASAYKDIDGVMENQKDLVEIVTKLSPIGVIKG